MIVDMILDRKNGIPYLPRKFYHYCLGYIGGLGDKITLAMDYGTEEDVKKALKEYIDEQEYNPNIKEYIDSQNWL